MDSGDPKTMETTRFDLLIMAGLAIAIALYYFVDNAWLSLAGACGFLLLAIRRLDLALVFVVFSSPFFLFPKRFGDLAFSLTEFTVLMCGFAALVHGGATLRRQGLAKCWRAFLRFLMSDLKAPVILFLVAATLSLVASDNLKVSLREYRTVVLEPALFYFLVTSYARERSQVWRLIDAFLLLSAGVALFSILHYSFVGMVESADGVRRALAIYHSPNALALFLGRAAPMFVVLALFYDTEANGDRKRILYALGGLTVFAALFITYSRGAWLGVAASLLFVAALKGRRHLMVAMAAAATALVALVPVVGIERLVSSATSIRRIYLWESAVSMIRDHPVFGVGLDNFLYQYPRYMLPEAWAEPNMSHPHNLVLDYWTRTGALGLVGLLWLQAKFWQTGIGLFRAAGNAKTGILGLALMASMADFLAHGLIDNSFFLIDLAVVFWLTYGSMEVLREGKA